MREGVLVLGRAVLLLALVFLFALVAAAAGAQTTGWDLAHAQLAISRDGRTVTVRSVVDDALRVCVEPRGFGPTRCFTVGALRRGEVR